MPDLIKGKLDQHDRDRWVEAVMRRNFTEKWVDSPLSDAQKCPRFPFLTNRTTRDHEGISLSLCTRAKDFC
jgi:hypothetical protein